MLFISTLVIATAALHETEYILKFQPNDENQILEKRDASYNFNWFRESLAKVDERMAESNSFAESEKPEPSEIIDEFEIDSFVGVAVKTTPEAVKELSKDSRVEYYVRNVPVVPAATFVRREERKVKYVPWNLDRIDQRYLPLDGKFKDLKHKGKNVTVYVIDTGIDPNHPDFGGRALVGPSFVRGQRKYYRYGNSISDHLGHGTHCAGTVGGNTYGVAREATIVGLKVIDEKGGDSIGTIKAIEYATRNGIPGKTVINMSLTTDISFCKNRPIDCDNPAIKDAVRAAIRKNIVVVAASGNSGVEACRLAPGSETLAFTVASSSFNDTQSAFSNHGACIDIFAPGERIISTWLNSKTKSMEGTSMAAPLVSGVIATLLSAKNYKTVQDVHKDVIDMSTKKVIHNISPNTHNRLLYVE